MTPAARALRKAQAAGVSVRLDPPGTLVLDAEREPPASLLQRLRDHKPELIQVLKGDRCRWCGEPLAWPGPAGIIFADGTAECTPCADREVGRLLAAGEHAVAPELADDPSEVMLRGELILTEPTAAAGDANATAQDALKLPQTGRAGMAQRALETLRPKSRDGTPAPRQRPPEGEAANGRIDTLAASGARPSGSCPPRRPVAAQLFKSGE